jgi:hypothetical protein
MAAYAGSLFGLVVVSAVFGLLALSPPARD